MIRDIKASDWKQFTSFIPIDRDRYSKRVLAEVEAILSKPDPDFAANDKFWAISDLVHKRTKEIREIFDDISRSTAKLYIIRMSAEELLSGEDLASFSPELRDWLEGIVKREVE